MVRKASVQWTEPLIHRIGAIRDPKSISAHYLAGSYVKFNRVSIPELPSVLLTLMMRLSINVDDAERVP